MSDQLTILYKCRRCSEVFSGISSSRETLRGDMIDLCEGRKPKDDFGWPPANLLAVHSCRDGCLGIGDMTGAGSSFTPDPGPTAKDEYEAAGGGQPDARTPKTDLTVGGKRPRLTLGPAGQDFEEGLSRLRMAIERDEDPDQTAIGFRMSQEFIDTLAKFVGAPTKHKKTHGVQFLGLPVLVDPTMRGWQWERIWSWQDNLGEKR